jgi:serine/threonine-protein kinase
MKRRAGVCHRRVAGDVIDLIVMYTQRGTVLGKYRLIAEIARGGMGLVYLAMVGGPGGFHKLVVVKELNPELVEDPAFLAMFLDEARLAARLSHPNIVQTNEVGHDGERTFLAMEYLDGRALDHVRRRAKTAGVQLPAAMNLRILADMLAGLDYAHRLTDFDGTPLHVVHRDVSPANVFVTFGGHVKLLDFGVAKTVSSSHETNAGVVKGKLGYMSPEQARGLKVDARADVFSAGVMLWEALTGRRLHAGRGDQEMLRALRDADLPRASSVKPKIPLELDEICARAMAWDRDERYQSAGALQEDLESYLSACGPTLTAREVGEFVSELFREDRVRTSVLIETHVARVRSGMSRDVPVIDVGARVAGGTPSDRTGAAAPFGGGDPFGEVDPPEPPSRPSGNVAVAAPSGSRWISRVSGNGRRRRPLVVAGAAAAATLAVVGLFALMTTDEAPTAAAVANVAAPAPSAPAPPSPVAPTSGAAVAPAPTSLAQAPAAAPETAAQAPRRSLVTVEVRVSPVTARLEIDDAELTSNPFIGGYVGDGSAHRVRASAPGYITKTVSITFDANVKLDLSLERSAPAHGAAAVRSAPARSSPAVRASPPPQAPAIARPAERAASEPAAERPAVPVEVDPSGGRKPHRPIDPNNPYGAGAIDPSNPYSSGR